MAFLPSASSVRTMALRFIMDNTDLVTGVDQSEAELQNLQLAADRASTDLGASFDAAGNRVGEVMGPNGTMNQNIAAGGAAASSQATQIGADVAQNVAQGIQTGDYSGALQSGLSQVGSAVAAAGNVAAAGVLIGAGIGTAIMKGIIDNIEKGEAEFAAAVKEMTDAVQKQFKADFGTETPTFLNTKAFRSATVDAQNLEDVLAGLGSGSEIAGLEKIKGLAADIGLDWRKIADLIRGRIGEGVRSTKDVLQGMVGEMEGVYKAGVKVGEVESERSRLAREVLAVMREQRAEVRRSVEYQEDLADYAYGYEHSWTTSAEALEKAATAAKEVRDSLNSIQGIPSLDGIRGKL
jgi:hypothetical protein